MYSDLYVKHLPLINSFLQRKKSFSSIILDDIDVTMKLRETLCDKQLISSEAQLETSSPVGSLMHAIDETITRAPGSLSDIVEEMGKYDCLKRLVESVKKREGKKRGVAPS